jgi:competence protein ComEC
VDTASAVNTTQSDRAATGDDAAGGLTASAVADSGGLVVVGSGGLGDVGSGGLVVVAHHGSADQSAALAKALAPKLAVMSAGRDNPYGHPSRAALDLYGGLAQVKRTDQDGLVVITAADLIGDGMADR